MTTSGELLIPAKETWKKILWNGLLPGSMAHLNMNAYNSERNKITEKTNTPLEQYIANSKWKRAPSSRNWQWPIRDVNT